MIRPSGLTVGRLAHGIPAPNDGGGGGKTIPAIPQTGATYLRHRFYGKTQAKMPLSSNSRARSAREAGAARTQCTKRRCPLASAPCAG